MLRPSAFLAPLLVLASFANAAQEVEVTPAAADVRMPRVDSGVHRALRLQGTVDMIVTMKDDPHVLLESTSTKGTRAEQLASFVEAAQLHARESQQTVLRLVNEEASGLFEDAQSIWLTNQVVVNGATPAFLERLVADLRVAEVREQVVVPLAAPTHAMAVNTTSEHEWGVDKVNAPAAWAKGKTGSGIIVGSIDGGVRASHEALRDGFLGEFGWYDAEKKQSVPYDTNGHGTHTMGIMVGKHGVGIAPNAKWLSCKGCRSDKCVEGELLACAQFMLCPTDPSGQKKDCSKAPYVVNNSWGGMMATGFFKPAVDAWIRAGIVPVFASGNNGPSCGSADSPVDVSNVLTVGATDVNDALGAFSSKGPTSTGLIKPDISAPGVQIRSASHMDDGAYTVLSGTSAAAPHVAGSIALMLSSNPDMEYAQVKKTLLTAVDTSSLKPTGLTCGGVGDDHFPNNNYGYGRINAELAVAK